MGFYFCKQGVEPSTSLKALNISYDKFDVIFTVHRR